MPDQILRYAELVEESTYAVQPPPAQANSKSAYFDVTTAGLDAPNEADAIVESAFGRAPNKKYAAFYNPAGDLAYQANIRTVVNLLKWTLGGYAFTQGAAGPPAVPNIHESWGSDLRTLPSFCARVGKDQFEHVFSGCIIDTLSFEVEDALVAVTAETTASRDAPANIQSQAAILAGLPTEVEIPFHQVDVYIAGVLQAAKVKNLSLSIGNNADAEAGRYLGSRYPGRIPANERETTLSMELDFSDKSNIERLWGGTQGPTIQGGSVLPMRLVFHGGRNAQNVPLDLDITLPKVFYTTVETQPEGRDETVQSVEARAMTSTVLLADSTTQIVTDIYTKTNNHAAIIEPAALVV